MIDDSRCLAHGFETGLNDGLDIEPPPARPAGFRGGRKVDLEMDKAFTGLL
jgi:hypothetical protein